MSYRIVIDSCCDMPEPYKNDQHFLSVPLTLEVGDDIIIDDETFDQLDFLAKVAAYPKSPKSSCPSPAAYAEAYECDADRIYVVTLSSKLSGSYNSALVGKEMYLDDNDFKPIYVCDSESASVGETQIAMKIMEYEERGDMTFAQIVSKIEDFRNRQHTYFVLDNLDTLRKNGRLSGVKALIASTLSIKPVMAGDCGSIVQKAQAVGIKKGLLRMIDTLMKEVPAIPEKTLYISHCNNPERAEFVKAALLERCNPKSITVLNTGGISSMYANDGGIIVTI
ncbi:MAG: DegV family protein [Lachnospiraceae bacterium]|nr:DegV family protein [Lachnospiraceae bacterium]